MSKHLSIYLLSACVLILVTYFAQYISLDLDVIAYAHDNYDSNVIRYKILSESGMLFSSNDEIVPNMMGGLPRSSYPSQFSILTVLYYLFDANIAYILNELIIHIVAFLGMLLLLSRYFNLSDSASLVTIYGVSICYAMLPFYPFSALSIAGLPLFLYAFSNIEAGRLPKTSWFIVLFYGLYSSLILSGVFLLALLAAYFLYSSYKKKVVQWSSVLVIVALTLVYILVEYRLFLVFLFDSGYISHREEFNPKAINLVAALSKAQQVFYKGHYHAFSLSKYYIYFFVIFISLSLIIKGVIRDYYFACIAIFMLVLFLIDPFGDSYWKYFVDNYLAYGKIKYLFLIVGAFVLIFLFYTRQFLSFFILMSLLVFSLFYGVWKHYDFVQLRKQYEFLKMFQFDRMYFFFGFFWFVLFSLLAGKALKISRYSKYFIYIILLKQVIYSISQVNANVSRTPMSMKAYYQEDDYAEIHEYIDEPKQSYRIASIGLNPAVSLYNGFFSLDGYSTNYPLNYKHEFRKIISGELDKSKKYKHYFDNWGSRCYIFVAEQADCGELVSIRLNIQQFKKMGGKYILSRDYLKNYNEIGLQHANTFDLNAYPWKIHLFMAE